MEVSKNVTVIPARKHTRKSKDEEKPKLQVAAYCRVSTDSDEQATSYDAQIEHYTAYINGHPDWELAGIYADDGISGTNTKKREEFNRMIDECMVGNIDMVITKSISRFARNTLDCLKYIRQLKDKNIPVFFEKENINSMDSKGEVMLTIMASLAQQESQSLSQNVKLGLQYRYQQGEIQINCARFLGYTKDENKHLVIVPEEAEIVKRIYREYLEGASMLKIARGLVADGILNGAGKERWHTSNVNQILRNEKYIGDALLQKTYVVDCITKETRKNNGEIPQYYVTGNHEPIISRDLFNLVQEEIARRAGKRKVAQKAVKTERGKYSSKYALTELLSCGDCGTQYRRVTWARGGKKKVVWRCINRLEYGTKYCKESPTLEESRLHTAIVAALNCLDNDKLDVMETLRAGLQLALGTQEGDSFNEGAIQNRIAELQSVMMDLVELSSKSSASADYFDAKFEEISTEIKSLQEQLGKHKQQTLITQNTKARIGELLAIMEQLDLSVKEYRDDVVRAIIAKVVVLSADRIRVTFDGGVEMEMELPGE